MPVFSDETPSSELEGTFLLNKEQAVGILVGGPPERDGCGGGATYVGIRTVEKWGWQLTTPMVRQMIVHASVLLDLLCFCTACFACNQLGSADSSMCRFSVLVFHFSPRFLQSIVS